MTDTDESSLLRPSPPWWAALIERVGVPSVILLALMYGMWRGAVGVALYLQPHVDATFAAHQDLLSVLAEQALSDAENDARSISAIESLARAQAGIAEALSSIEEVLAER